MATAANNWEKIKAVFEGALDLPVEQRAAFVSRYAGSESVRASVERLLADHEDAGSFLSTPVLQEIDTPTSVPDPRFCEGKILANRFRVVRFIAAGGMGEVYEARDLELKERVAIKTILPNVLKNPNAISRFRREVQLARKVTHSNVCRIYDLFRHEEDKDGTKSEFLLVSMELLTGATLAQYLRTVKRLGLQEAVRLLREMAGALAAAHQLGIVHRDFKPGNVVLVPTAARDSRAVVTDFGLAIKSITPEESTLSDNTLLTDERAIIGTPAYMSPEQLEGKPATAASDVFALGIVAYEVTTGVHPFRESSVHLQANAILNREVQRPSTLNKQIPPGLDSLIIKALQKRPDDRYRSAASFLGALNRIDSLFTPVHDVAEASSWTAKTGVEHVSEGIDSGRVPKRVPRTALILVALLLVVGSAVTVSVRYHNMFVARRSVTASPRTDKIAVLPFEWSGDESTVAYIAEGLPRQIASRLSQFHSIYVSDPDSVRKAASETPEPSKIGRRLGVNAIVRGKLEIVGHSVKLSMSLEDVDHPDATTRTVFSEDGNKLLDLEDRTYQFLITQLRLENSSDGFRAGMRPAAGNPTYTLYLKGLYAQSNDQDDKRFDSAISLYKEAIQREPAFTLAEIGIAHCYLKKYEVSKNLDFVKNALTHVRKALQLDDESSAAHNVLSEIYLATKDKDKAVREATRSFELSPHSDTAYLQLGDIYVFSGDYKTAITAYEKACAVNPMFWKNYNSLGKAYFIAGDNIKALAAFEKVKELNPDSPLPYENIGSVYMRQGNWSKCIPMFEKAVSISPDAATYSNIGTAYFFLRRYPESVRMFEKSLQLNGNGDEVLWGNLGDGYRWTGENDKATNAYKRAIAIASMSRDAKSSATMGDIALYYSKIGDGKEAVRYIELARAKDRSDLQLIYSEVQIYALLGDSAKAITALKFAVARGYPRQEIGNDPELASLKSMPEFIKILEQSEPRHNSAPTSQIVNH